MSKQRIDEMKKFMQIAEGNVAEAKVDPKLRKAGKILMQVVDGLEREYEELMNGADGDAEEIEFAEHVAEDAEDYKKIVNMLMKGQGKQAAKFYDGLDTVSREFVYDHAYSDVEFLQKVFGDLGSDWLFLEYDDEYDEELDEDSDEGVEACLWCGEEYHTEDECGDFPFATDMDYEMNWDTGEIVGYDPEGREIAARPGREVRYLDAPPKDPVPCPACDGTAVDVGHGYECEDCGEIFTWVGSPFDGDLVAGWSDDALGEGWFDDLGTGEEFARGEKDVCKKCGREGCECGPDCDCEPVEEDLDPDGMGYYNVTISINGEYPDEVETAVDYDTAVDTAKDVAEAWKKGRWQMQTWNKGDAKEWHVRGDDGRMEEWFVVIRVEPTDDADVEAWHGESIELGKLAESVLEDSYADYVDWEDEADEEPQEQFKLPMGMELVDEDSDPDEDGDGVIDDDEIDRMIDVGDDEDYEYNDDDINLDDLGFSINLDDEY